MSFMKVRSLMLAKAIKIVIDHTQYHQKEIFDRTQSHKNDPFKLEVSVVCTLSNTSDVSPPRSSKCRQCLQYA